MKPHLENHKDILQILTTAGHQAYFVGGCVRDLLIGRVSKDIDICTSAFSDQVAALFPGAEKVGAAFGVVLVKHNGVEAEVATFRNDGNYSDSRHPDSVEFTSDVVEDLKRRDFTINALLMDIEGNIIDHVGGREDLENGLIRCIGDPHKRFEEDALRMLRAVRLSAQLGFAIERSTREIAHYLNEGLAEISKERVQQELAKMLTSGRAAQAITDLNALNMLTFVAPELCDLHWCQQNPMFHPEGDVYTHTMGLLKQLPAGCSLTLALAALLHDIGKPGTKGEKNGQPTFYGHEELGAEMAERILRRLKFSNEVIEAVTSHVAQHMTFRLSKVMRKSKLLRFVRHPHFAELLELHRMDATAGSGNLENYEHCLKVMNETPPEVLRPERFVTGKDLIEMGLTPGPRFKEILEYVETLQLEGVVENEGQAYIALYDYARDASRCEVCGFAAMDVEAMGENECGKGPHFTEFYPRAVPA